MDEHEFRKLRQEIQTLSRRIEAIEASGRRRHASVDIIEYLVVSSDGGPDAASLTYELKDAGGSGSTLTAAAVGEDRIYRPWLIDTEDKLSPAPEGSRALGVRFRDAESAGGFRTYWMIFGEKLLGTVCEDGEGGGGGEEETA